MVSILSGGKKNLHHASKSENCFSFLPVLALTHISFHWNKEIKQLETWLLLDDFLLNLAVCVYVRQSPLSEDGNTLLYK